MIDTNVYLSRWPFRRLPGDDPEKLVTALRRHGVKRAWAGSFDALLHRDIAGVNRRLAQSCQKYGDGVLVPMGAVNPTLPDWQEDLRRCHEEYGMAGIRLHPNYHGYSLDMQVFAELLQRAGERKLLVQIAVTMEDERTQHPLVQVPHVDTKPLAALAKEHPQLQLQLLGAFRNLKPVDAATLATAGNVHFEISMLEGVAGVAKLLKHVPVENILFGSHFPLFYVESALLKLQESDLPRFQREAILHDNARRILKSLQ